MKMQYADLDSGLVPYYSECTSTAKGLDGIHL